MSRVSTGEPRGVGRYSQGLCEMFGGGPCPLLPHQENRCTEGLRNQAEIGTGFSLLRLFSTWTGSSQQE